MPVEQAVFILGRDNARKTPLFGRGQIFLDSPGRLIGEADGSDLAGPDEPAHRLEDVDDVGDGLVAILRKWIVVPALAKVKMSTVGPVNLIEIDIVGLQ